MTRLIHTAARLSGIALLALTGTATAFAQQGYWAPQPEYNSYYHESRYGVERARDLGYHDGAHDGERDRLTGHSFRPTHGDRYEDASDHGDREGLSRGEFKEIYRDAYLRGYERGYQSAGRERGYYRDGDDRY